MDKLQDLVATLSASGPVFVAGDFNSQWAANDPWGPRRMLGSQPGGLPADVAMRTTMDVLGLQPPTTAAGPSTTSSSSPRQPPPHASGPRTSTPTTTSSAPTSPSATATSLAGGTDQRLGLDATQWKHAAQIVAAGRGMGIPSQGIVIALAVASQESGFRV